MMRSGQATIERQADGRQVVVIGMDDLRNLLTAPAGRSGASRPSGAPIRPEFPVLEIERLTTSSQTFQTVAEVSMRFGFRFILTNIEVEADFDPQQDVNDYTQARWRITIGDKVRDGGGGGFSIFQSLTLDFAAVELNPEGSKFIRVEVRSADGSSITVDADIVGKEVLA